MNVINFVSSKVDQFEFCTFPLYLQDPIAILDFLLLSRHTFAEVHHTWFEFH